MHARRKRQLRDASYPQAPTRQSSSYEVPSQPGLFAGRERKDAYQQALQKRRLDQQQLDSQFNQAQAQYRKDYNAAARTDARNQRFTENNELVAQRESMLRHLPYDLRKEPATQVLGDRAVDVINASRYAQAQVGQGLNSLGRKVSNTSRSITDVATNPVVLGGVGSTVATAALLNAYNDQQQAGLDTGFLPTVGRATGNAIGGIGSMVSGIGTGTVGQDPLAQARNNIRTSQEALASNRVLEAVVLDAIDPQMQAQVEAEVAAMDVETLIDAKANELMGTPYIDASGNTRYMSPQDAYSKALQIFELDQKY